MVTREEIHKLIDQLEQDDLEVAALYLQNLRESNDPLLQALAKAPLDDEPETSEEAADVAASRAEIARGEFSFLDDIRDELLRAP